MIRLVIADDHAIVRGGLKQIFEHVADLQVVGEASNGAEVLARVRHDDLDLLLLDMNMPGISGADLIRRVKLQRPVLPILVLSMHNAPQVAAQALKAGASGYVTKDSEPETLITAIRKVAAGGRYIVPELAEQMVFDVRSNSEGPAHTLLTERELEEFRLLVTGKSSNEIAGLLAISNKTVSTHKTRLMEKMNISSMADLMRYAIEHGFVN